MMNIDLHVASALVGTRMWSSVPRVGDIVVLGKVQDAVGFDGARQVERVEWGEYRVIVRLSTSVIA